MPEPTDLDHRLREKELERLESEILRNRAEYESLRRNNWKVGTAAGLTILGAVALFVGFFSDFYTVAFVDRGARDRQIATLTTENETLTDANRGLTERVRVFGDASSRLDAAVANVLSRDKALDEIRSIVTAADAASDPSRVLSQVQARLAASSSPSRAALSEKDLEGSILVVWWAGGALDALVVGLHGPTTPSATEQFAEGASLSDEASGARSQEWVGRWRLANGRVTLDETFPNPRAGTSIEMDLTRDVAAGKWLVLRTAQGVSTRGVGQLLQPGALPPRP
jgi:hypothetical protein